MNDDQKYIPVSEAARILTCSNEKVHELCDQGLIRRHFEGDEVYVRREDVAELHRLNIIGEMRPGEMVRRLIMAEQEIRRLRSAVDLLYEVNGLAASRFAKLEDAELFALAKLVVDLSGEEEWSPKRIEEIAELFMKITEVEIDRLNEIQKLDNSWLPFFQLCLQMTRQIVQDPNLETDVTLQRVHAKLTMGRKNLSTIAMFFIEQAGVLSTSRELLTRLAAVDIDAFDVLARTMKKRGSMKLTK